MNLLINKKILNTFKNFKELEDNSVAVAVSGGIDSMSLVLSMNEYSKKNNLKITALTVDHKLRKESTEEAEYVSNICKKFNIEHHILTWDEEKPKTNIEAIAREKRYNLISNFCEKNKIKYLITAHHLEDQAETFFIRLFRGSGIDGLSSMSEISNLFGLTIIRPFLNLHKSDLKNFLIENNIKWVEDKSNSDEKFLRNKIRNFLNTFENKQQITERINFAIQEIVKCKKNIENELEEVEKNILDFSSFGICLIYRENLISIEEDLALRLLAKTSMKISGNIYKPRLEKLKRLFSEIKNNSNIKYTFYGCIFQKYDKDKIVVYREYNAICEDIKLEYNKTIIWDNKFKITLTKNIDNIYVSHVKEGEFNEVLEAIRIFDFKKYKELKLIKGIEKNIFYTLPIAKQNNKYLFDYFYMRIEEL